MRFQDKVVVVFGGNSGIGLAAARGFAAEGAKVVITGRNQATLDEAAASIPGAVAHQGDMADVGRTQAIVAAVGKSHGRIDSLFVNAGVGAFAAVEEVTPELWDQVHSIDLRGAFFAMQAALPLIGEGGSIVVTGSTATVKAPPHGIVYGAAKAGLRNVVRIFAREVVARGVRINMISPGPIDTPIIDRNLGADGPGGAELRKFMGSVVPMGRLGTPDEAARAVLFLASSDASFITGIELFVDGGLIEL